MSDTIRRLISPHDLAVRCVRATQQYWGVGWSGPLHVVIEDGNLDDQFIERARPGTQEFWDSWVFLASDKGWPHDDGPDEAALFLAGLTCDALLALDRAGRLAAIKEAVGYDFG